MGTAEGFLDGLFEGAADLVGAGVVFFAVGEGVAFLVGAAEGMTET